MRGLIQRVSSARVDIDGVCAGEIGEGLLILVCAMHDDTEANAETLARKVAALRIFRDEAGKMNRSIKDIGGSALVVSQFTLAADTSRGNRPGFSAAAPPERGEQLYEHFCSLLTDDGITVATGRFGADMKVSLTNDGPVTISMEF
ncbi:MAG: D-tyrosyl-tRNA(Tyr) deacylase [Rhizobiales bacterium]|nr:D-tyrosyl-tRNA(Tyr) deacylase [Hyphomicrobiales bacterium]